MISLAFALTPPSGYPSFMSNSIGRLSGVAAIRLSGTGKGGNKTGAALASLASQIAGHVADAFNLASDDNGDGRGRNFLAANDLYEIDAMANELSTQLAGTAPDKAKLSAALHRFAEESAALLGARPAAYSIQHLAGAIDTAARSTAPENIAASLAMIDQASSIVAGANHSRARK